MLHVSAPVPIIVSAPIHSIVSIEMSAADGFRYTPVLVVYEAPFPEGVFAVFFAVLSTAVIFAVFPARSRAVEITVTFARVRHAQIRKRLMRISWAFRGTSYPNI